MVVGMGILMGGSCAPRPNRGGEKTLLSRCRVYLYFLAGALVAGYSRTHVIPANIKIHSVAQGLSKTCHINLSF